MRCGSWLGPQIDADVRIWHIQEGSCQPRARWLSFTTWSQRHPRPLPPCIHTSSQPNRDCQKRERASLPHCLPNYPVLGASCELKVSIFAASSPQVQELGNWEFSPKRALFALPDLLVTARGSCRVLLLSLLCFAVGRSDCLLHHGALKSFCCALGVLGQKLHFICFCSTRGTNTAQSTGEASVVLLQPCRAASTRSERVSPGGVRPPGLPLYWHSVRPCRRARFCSISRPPIQIQALLAPVKLSDNLQAGAVPHEQMGMDSLAAKSPGCSSGRGEAGQSSSAKCQSYEVTEGKAVTVVELWLGHGVFCSGVMPPWLHPAPLTWSC